MWPQLLFLAVFISIYVCQAERKFNDRNRDKLTRIVYGEARGESGAGQEAVAHSIMNRYADRRNFPTKSKGDDRLETLMNKKYSGGHEYNTLDNKVFNFSYLTMRLSLVPSSRAYFNFV